MAISNNFEYLFGQLSFVEIFQVILLISALLIQFIFKRNFLTKYTSLQFWLRGLLFIFLIYEELSFLTHGLNSYFNQSNVQSEINIHNSIFMQKQIIDFNFSPINYSGLISLFVVLSILAAFIWGFGSYFPFFKKSSFYNSP